MASESEIRSMLKERDNPPDDIKIDGRVWTLIGAHKSKSDADDEKEFSSDPAKIFKTKYHYAVYANTRQMGGNWADKEYVENIKNRALG
jgi:hypothetical protein